MPTLIGRSYDFHYTGCVPVSGHWYSWLHFLSYPRLILTELSWIVRLCHLHVVESMMQVETNFYIYFKKKFAPKLILKCEWATLHCGLGLNLNLYKFICLFTIALRYLGGNGTKMSYFWFGMGFLFVSFSPFQLERIILLKLSTNLQCPLHLLWWTPPSSNRLHLLSSKPRPNSTKGSANG